MRPVLAFRCGSIPKVIAGGVTDKMVDGDEEAIAALPTILSYGRRAVRQRFEERLTVRQRFEERLTATRMAKDYVGTDRHS
jgi:hypothetical protein